MMKCSAACVDEHHSDKVEHTSKLQALKISDNSNTTKLSVYIGTIQRRQWHPLQYSCLENPMNGGAW